MNDYIEELESHLSPLTRAERSDVIEFYSEYLQDSGLVNYQQTDFFFWTPKQIARENFSDYFI